MDRAFDRLLSGYKWSLQIVLRHRLAMLIVFTAVLISTVEMYRIIPTGFIPDQDNDSLFVNMRAAQGTSYYDMAKWVQQVGDVIIKDPDVDSFIAQVGGGGPGGGGSANNSRLPVQLRPPGPAQSHRAADRAANPLRRSCDPGFRALPGCRPHCRSGDVRATRTTA